MKKTKPEQNKWREFMFVDRKTQYYQDVISEPGGGGACL